MTATAARERAHTFHCSLASVLIAGAAAQTAYAQESAPSSAGQPVSLQLEEVVVVAEKRAANLQQVAIVATAISGAELAAKGAATTKDLQTVVPGLVFNQHLPAGNPYLRGVGQNAGAVGIESPVAFYIDGVYLAQSGASLLALNNIEQITVLKGPQGTLFGRNASGGVVQIATKRPSDQFTMDAELGYANYEAYSGRVYASGPLDTDVRLSVAAFGNDQNKGFGRNLLLDEEIYKDHSYGGQVRLEWTPTDATTLDLNLLHTKSLGYAGVVRSVLDGSLGEDGQTVYVGEYNSVAAIDAKSHVDQSLAALTATHDTDSARYQVIAAFHEFHEKYPFVQNALPTSAVIATFDDPARTYTLEAQVQSPSDDAFQWVLGGFYFYDITKVRFSVARDATVLSRQETKQDSESYAAFAQGTVPLGAATRVTAGVRYTKDQKDISGSVFNGAGSLVTTAEAAAAAAGFSPRSTWDELSYRLSVDHDLSDDSLVYASYNRGFKSGIYNPTSFSNPPALPEIVDAFEIGSKNMFFDRMVRLNVGLFLYKYDDLQLRTVVPPSVNFVTYNAAKSTVKGVDIDMAFKATANLTLTGAAEYLDGQYDDFPAGLCVSPRPSGGNITTTCDLSDTRMMRAPKWTGNIGANYVFELAGNGSLALDTNWAYNSGFVWEPDGRTRQEAYHSVAASVRWNPVDARWSVTLWGTNLLDEKIRSSVAETSTDNYSAGVPRRYGVTLGYDF